MFSTVEKKIIRKLQEDLPLVPQPYKTIADELGITEEILLKKINEFKERGLIRRMGAALCHRETGYKANAMVVWIVPTERIEEIGMTMASFSEVTHCYQRPTFPDWPYNMFTMIHGKTREECKKVVEKIASNINIDKYKLLYSTVELKKSSMKYFMEEN